MKLRRALTVAATVLSMAAVARSGHEQSVYPSYYPHEIEVKALAPGPAAELLRAGKLHAYLGEVPPLAAGDGAATVESLGPSSSSASMQTRRALATSQQPAPLRQPWCATWPRGVTGLWSTPIP